MGRHLGIDFSSILVDFGRQVGRQNRAKIDQKLHRKNDGKKKGSKIVKKGVKSASDPLRHHGSEAPGRGVRGPGDETVEMETILLDSLYAVHYCML